MKYLISYGLLITTLFPMVSHSQITSRESNILSTPITWQAIQKKNVVKQNVDYSCGSASLATILTYFYNQPTTESQVIKDLALNKQMASFQDLANVSQKYGFIGRGIATNYDSLKKIKIPAIVYLNHNRTDHFSVLRAIDDTHVYLADPSWGNRTLTRKQFEKIWNTRNDAQYQGKVLLILPTDNKQKQLASTTFTAIHDTQNLLKQVPVLLHPFL
jgi:predicted double-glycine peptidase